jgi:acyl-CoA synthetase (NDP forming)
MANNKTAVRAILDKVKAEGRTSLTAPEGKLACDAYGIAVPKEGVATSAAEAAKMAAGIGFPVVLKIVSPKSCTRPRAGGVAGRRQDRRGRAARLRHDLATRKSTTRRRRC